MAEENKKVEDAMDKAKEVKEEVAEDVKEEAVEVVEDVKEEAVEVVEDVKEVVEDVKEVVVEVVEETKKETKEMAKEVKAASKKDTFKKVLKYTLMAFAGVAAGAVGQAIYDNRKDRDRSRTAVDATFERVSDDPIEAPVVNDVEDFEFTEF